MSKPCCPRCGATVHSTHEVLRLALKSFRQCDTCDAIDDTRQQVVLEIKSVSVYTGVSFEITEDDLDHIATRFSMRRRIPESESAPHRWTPALDAANERKETYRDGYQLGFFDGRTAGRSEAQSSVRLWHPSCLTCRHGEQHGSRPSMVFCKGLSYMDEDHYCADHTEIQQR